jgi:CheY-like chemotaxis protein
VLVVEDEMLIAMMVEDMLIRLGASVVGPASNLAEALEMANSADFDVALLDVNLRNERVDPVVAVLAQRCIPMVLATGYGRTNADLPSEATVIEKPYTEDRLSRALSSVV